MSEFSEDKEKNIIEITSNKEKEAVKPLTPAKLEKFKKAQDNTGIIYLSSIPPFMKPSKVKHLLEQFGNIGRVYLAPEDPKTRIRRKKYGGNKKKKYTEGWIEFLDKRIAKTVANTLNAQPIGGNKRNYYHDDLWNIKYLPKFKWTNLTDQIVHEKATRIQRLQAEISQARRENKEYLKKVEKAKMIKSMEEKKEKKRKVAEVEETNLETFTEADTREKKKKKVKEFQSDNKSFEDDDNSEKYSKFKQRKLVINEVIEGRKNDEPTNTSEGVKKILSKIFMK